jgi:hypothetical protein
MEAYRVLVRLNPVRLQVLDFTDYVDQIGEAAENYQRAEIIGQALEAVDLAKAVKVLDESDEQIVELTP